jgi:hypothetical protein
MRDTLPEFVSIYGLWRAGRLAEEELTGMERIDRRGRQILNPAYPLYPG